MNKLLQNKNYKKIIFAEGGKKLTSKHLNTTPVYEEDWSDKAEPWTAGIGLAADAVGLGTAATGVGIPVGATIALVGNIPNVVIDGYLFGRDIYRSVTDGWSNNIQSTATNGVDLVLDFLGLKMISALNKSKIAKMADKKVYTKREQKSLSYTKRVGTGAGRVIARLSARKKAAYNAKRNEAYEKAVDILAKRGVRPVQGPYFKGKLIDEMAKQGFGISYADALKSAEKTARQNAVFGNLLSGGQNMYHLEYSSTDTQNNNYTKKKHQEGGVLQDNTLLKQPLVQPKLDNSEWYNSMTSKNYNLMKLKDGTYAFGDNKGNIYYNNGRIKYSDGRMANYNYNSLPKLTKLTLNGLAEEFIKRPLSLIAFVNSRPVPGLLTYKTE